jgi:hypothetical protein
VDECKPLGGGGEPIKTDDGCGITIPGDGTLITALGCLTRNCGTDLRLVVRNSAPVSFVGLLIDYRASSLSYHFIDLFIQFSLTHTPFLLFELGPSFVTHMPPPWPSLTVYTYCIT